MTQHEYRDHEMPKGLCGFGITAVDIIRGTLRAEDALFTGGCKPFYSPDEWRDRDEWATVGGEPKNVVLIVCHDGGDMSLYGGRPNLWATLRRELHNAGYFVARGTGWWSYVMHPDARVFGDRLKLLHSMRGARHRVDPNFVSWLVRVVSLYQHDTGNIIANLQGFDPRDRNMLELEDELERWVENN